VTGKVCWSERNLIHFKGKTVSMFRTRTQMGELDLCWVSRSELTVRENPVFHSLRLYSLSFIESSY
jgi:hypothetical protein